MKPVPLVAPGYTSATVTDKISEVVLRRTPRWWYVGFGASFLLVMLLFYAIAYLVTTGVGIWGNNIPVAWGWDITNFVWWIGIGHAGTLISAILLLLRQNWRNSINRFAEAMTLFAVACAGLYPLAHLGRPWPQTWNRLQPLWWNTAQDVTGPTPLAETPTYIPFRTWAAGYNRIPSWFRGNTAQDISIPLQAETNTFVRMRPWPQAYNRLASYVMNTAQDKSGPPQPIAPSNPNFILPGSTAIGLR